MVLLRKVIGDVLRARRLAQHRTLREVSTAANVSLGYLSEIERGHKEASSELLGAICEALGTGLSDVLGDVAATFALAEQMEDAFTTATADHAAHQAAGQAAEQTVEQTAELALVGAGDKLVGAGDKLVGGGDTLVADKPSADAMVGDTDVTDGEVTVRVRSDGPLRTTLTTKRTPGPRHPETVFVG